MRRRGIFFVSLMDSCHAKLSDNLMLKSFESSSFYIALEKANMLARKRKTLNNINESNYIEFPVPYVLV